MSDIILPNNGYKNLLTYQKSDIIFKGTVIFVRRFLSRGDRTIDQMVQATRSGKQNIIEGSAAAGTSKETELKLTNVAKASLEELLEDYLDYLKPHELPLWDKDSEKGQAARKLGWEADTEKWLSLFEGKSAEVVANLQVSLIKQCTYLLAKQLAYLEEDFKQHGGIRERMYAARKETRASGWETSLADFLDAAQSAEDLNVRFRQAEDALRRIFQRVKAKREW